MSGDDFEITFNAALQQQDWPLVIILGESALAEGRASDALRYNLGLAYVKTNKPALATSVLVSVSESRRDETFKTLLSESLRLSSASIDDFDTGAHGLTSTLCLWAARIRPYDPMALAVSGLAVTMLLLMARLILRRLVTTAIMKTRCDMVVKLLVVLGFGVTCIGLAGSGLGYFYQSRWGVVVADQGASIFGLPTENAPLQKKLKKGKPILVLGDPTSAWVRVIESDGGAGWTASLDVRVVRE